MLEFVVKFTQKRFPHFFFEIEYNIARIQQVYYCYQIFISLEVLLLKRHSY